MKLGVPAENLQWVTDVAANWHASDEFGVFWSTAASGDHLVAPKIDARVTAVISRKGDQHVEWANRGVLAIVAQPRTADDLRQGFARCAMAIPWWRLFVVEELPRRGD
jgi:hypothetical protein